MDEACQYTIQILLQFHLISGDRDFYVRHLCFATHIKGVQCLFGRK